MKEENQAMGCGAASSAAAEMTRRQQRRLALHQAAVAVLNAHPGRASRVSEVLDRWEAMRPQNPGLISQWRRILETKQWAALLEDAERGDTLRKGSAFPFVLDAEERLSIIAQYSRKALREREAARRLVALGGLASDVQLAPRRRE